jgi:hypothetical protein
LSRPESADLTEEIDFDQPDYGMQLLKKQLLLGKNVGLVQTVLGSGNTRIK